MNFANYGRKSVFSDKSDSVDNQYRMAKEYAEMHFRDQIDMFLHYHDEDFTGANTERPGLERLFEDIKAGHIDALIVYQLDRLSRDVRDFSNLYALLEEFNVKFISLRENIDTTTPIGKAMMYVSVVFAQMERETIANRVADNMLGLAKKGYWAGGNPPRGYVRKNITIDGKNHVIIVPDPEGVKYVNWVFDTYLDNNYSLSGFETYLRQNGIRTEKGKYFSATQLHRLLSMPYCVQATADIYDYFSAKGCIMDDSSPREKWDGTRGPMLYGRTSHRSGAHTNNPPEKWVVCLGMHEPFMDADKWLKVQKQFGRHKFEKTTKYDTPLLKRVLRCSCGTSMATARKKLVYSVSSYYYCTKQMRQGFQACNAHHIKHDVLDQKVIEVLRTIEHDPAAISKFVKRDRVKIDIKPIQKNIRLHEQKISRLTTALSEAAGTTATKYIVSEITQLDLELQALRRDETIALNRERTQLLEEKKSEDIAAEIIDMMKNFDELLAEEKNELIRNVVRECVWDGQKLFIYF